MIAATNPEASLFATLASRKPSAALLRKRSRKSRRRVELAETATLGSRIQFVPNDVMLLYLRLERFKAAATSRATAGWAKIHLGWRPDPMRA